MDKKKLFMIIGIVLALIVLVKFSIIGYYPNEIILYSAILLVALIFMTISRKIKPAQKETSSTNASMSSQWKCSCGRYNDDGVLLCGSCNNKKPS
jgi:type III secretory pathway component EscV